MPWPSISEKQLWVVFLIVMKGGIVRHPLSPEWLLLRAHISDIHPKLWLYSVVKYQINFCLFVYYFTLFYLTSLSPYINQLSHRVETFSTLFWLFICNSFSYLWHLLTATVFSFSLACCITHCIYSTNTKWVSRAREEVECDEARKGHNSQVIWGTVNFLKIWSLS